MLNESNVTSAVCVLKKHFLESMNPDRDNEVIHQAYQVISVSFDEGRITYDCFLQLHNDIDDWGMQKTLAEVLMLPVSNEEKRYKDYSF